jgi:HSP20 family protein
MSEIKEKEMVDIREQNSLEDALQNEAWVAPAVDIYETEDAFRMNAFIPGVNKENLKIKIEEENLIIMGRIDFEGLRSKKYVMRESRLSNYYRKFKLSDSIDESRIDAEIKDGILTVTLPKHERVKPKVIEIK